MLALDARVVVYPDGVREETLPQLAIRPYPTEYVWPWSLSDGAQALIRPIHPEDEPLLVQFHTTLSAQTVERRYFHSLRLAQRVAHERLIRICFNDYNREIALVVEHDGAQGGEQQILAVGRLRRLSVPQEAEFAIVVSDSYQHRGLGTELLRRLIEVGRAEQIQHITGSILAENRAMQRVCEKLGFHLRRDRNDLRVIVAEIELG
jgi:acetyltransferase